MQRLTSVCLLSVLFFAGCSRLLSPAKHDTAGSFAHRCSPPAIHRSVSLAAIEKPVGESGEVTAQLPTPDAFSTRAIAAAYAIDALPLLKDIAALEQQGDSQAVPLLKVREKLIGRILLATEEVSSLTAEIVCESDRADQIADRLQDELSTRVKYETLGAIVIAGMAAIASGGLILAAGLPVAEATAAIAGGTLAAGLGSLPLFAESHQEYTHPRNLLREIWEGPRTSKLFPKSVWRYLTRQQKAKLEGKHLSRGTDRELAARGAAGRVGLCHRTKTGPASVRRRGVYELQDLRARSAMLWLLGSTVEMMHQDLETLIREVLIQEALGE
jgi:hypothetical protein